jgi:STE24 endopeptidase
MITDGEQATTERVTLDQDWQDQLREFNRQLRRVRLLGIALTIVYTLLWLLSGLAVWLRHVMNGLTTNDWLRVAGFSIVFFGSLWLLKLPLAYRMNVVLIQRYQMPVKPHSWLADQLKVGLATGIIGGFAIEIVYSGLRDLPFSWADIGANVIAAAVPLLYAPRFISYLFYDYQGPQDEQLSSQLAQFGAKAGVEVGGAYRLAVSHRTDAAMAMTSHRNGKRSVMISDTMMQQFTPDEIETTIAHEIGHHIHHDGRWGTWFSAILIIIRIYLSIIALYWLMGLVGIRSIGDTAGIPLFALLLMIIGVTLLPLKSGFSRWRERMADEYALKVTGKPQAFASEMIKFANQSFYEANPDWLTRITLTHPSYSERIAMAERYTEELETQDGQWRLA